MFKPSIFSKDYDRLMKKRKKRIKIIMFVSIIVGGLTFIFIGYNLKNNIIANLSVFNRIINLKKEYNDTSKFIDMESNNVYEDNTTKDYLIVTLKNNIKIEIKVNKSGEYKVIDDYVKNENIHSFAISDDKKSALIIDKDKNIYNINLKENENNFNIQEYKCLSGKNSNESL